MTEEFLAVTTLMEIEYKWSAGPYLGKLLTEMRDNGRLWAVRCPKCNRLMFPPRIACGKCHTKAPEFPQGWVELSGRGYLDSWTRISAPQMDPSTGEIAPDPYLHCNVILEEGAQFSHFLGITPGSPEENKLQRGMQVEAEFKPGSERTGQATDIKYFRVIWDGPPKKLGRSVCPSDM